MRWRSRRTAIMIVAASACLLVAGGCAVAAWPGSVEPAAAKPAASASAVLTPTPSTAATPEPSDAPVVEPSSAASTTALEVLATLEVKGRAPKTGYDREEFGQRWLDIDRNGCDTRNDILERDLTHVVKSGGCKVLNGTLHDPYTGATIAFVRGQDTSTAVQIDHVVALSDAWQKGAQRLTAEQRASFANDPLNLWAVDGPANAQKSDGDAATWLPSNKSFRCEYVARQVSVKAAYALWVTAAEHDAIARVLSTCSDEPAVKSTAVSGPVVPDSAPMPDEAPPSDVFYENCSAVRAAGAAPIRTGDPGYSHTLDRDKDGIACE